MASLPVQEKMTATEVRASISLASIYGLRMLGMFLILPIFSIYAETLPDGQNHMLIGLALGAYGLTQAIFQLPFGMASDRFGRKQVIYVGLILFVLGSLIAGMAHSLVWVAVGRAVQGAGAVSAAVTALVADLTREEHRTKAMAMIGGTIGITFALSLTLGPLLNQWIGVDGIFMLTAVLATLAILVVKFIVPNPTISQFHSDAQANRSKLKEVLLDKQLLRLNYGIFALHAAQMAMFVVVPFAIRETSQLNENQHWMIYLPILLVSFVLMVPAIIYGEKKAQLKRVFTAAILVMLLAQLMFAGLVHYFWGILLSLCAYFIAFNVLEASLPSIITKIAPAASKGTAIGVYNTSQSFGVFVGGLLGGYLSHYFGFAAVFIFCSILMALWALLAFTMQAPPAVRSKMYHLGKNATKVKNLVASLAALPGVKEAVVLQDEGVAIIKIDMHATWDETKILKLIGD
jgi:MFS family permease